MCEIARRSAEFYMDKYFQHLKARSSRLETAPNTHFDASDVVESRGEQLHDSKYWNMKAARDCLIKDLNDMSFWIQQLAPPRQSEVRTPMRDGSVPIRIRLQTKPTQPLWFPQNPLTPEQSKALAMLAKLYNKELMYNGERNYLDKKLHIFIELC
ncbi:hypothetical protein IFR05_015745 [Cadophora sp. M221]|nr:hypothetical protein IFR05_015745 [Cadophora sp. M221]